MADVSTLRLPGKASYSLQPLMPRRTSQNGKKWSKQNENKLLDLFSMGYSVGEIAEHLGRTATAVASRLQTHGFIEYDKEHECLIVAGTQANTPKPAPNIRYYDEKDGATEVAQNARNPFAQKILTIVRACKGIKAKDIAKRLGVTRKDVNSHLFAMERDGLCSRNSVTFEWEATGSNVVSTPTKPAIPSKQESQTTQVKVPIRKEESEKITIEPSRRHQPYKSISGYLEEKRISMKKPIDVPYRPSGRDAESLFEYAIKNLADKSQRLKDLFEQKTHNQWSNICFPIREWRFDEKCEMMSKIHSHFSVYFKGRNKYTFDIKTIERDFPQYFEGYEEEDPFEEMLNAVRSEYEFAKDPKNKEKYSVNHLQKESNTSDIYQITLNLKDDEEPRFYEGVKLRLQIGDTFYNCIGVDYDIATASLYASCDRTIYWSSNRKNWIYMDSSFILEAVYDRMKQLLNNNLSHRPVFKLLEDTVDVVERVFTNTPITPSMHKGLDPSQKDAFEASLRNNLTFIWGPPGTGKSFTLASVIRTLFNWKESTLVCCLSNVATDQLLGKVIDLFASEKIYPLQGQLYRAGRSLDEKVLNTDYLFLNDKLSDEMRKEIKSCTKSIDTLKRGRQMKEIAAEIHELEDRRLRISENLKKHTKKLIDSSKVVFSTIANFILTKELCDRRFDNLIVDEASMLSLPYLMAIAPNVTKRIILVGDPQQLGPIATCPSKWLQRNVFDFSGVLENDSPALKQLLVQRRSHPNIVKLINAPFYKGRLKDVPHECPNWVMAPPFAGKVVHAVKAVPDDEVKYVGKTRRNFGTLEEVMRILNEYFKKGNYSFSIGVITPYRGQVKLYMGAISSKKKECRPWEMEFWENIKVGTIHTFQGSECDLIILDIVEKAPEPVGKLYHHDTGAQLINVALSRAKHKLIIVGDTPRFKGGAGIANVAPSVVQVLGGL